MESSSRPRKQGLNHEQGWLHSKGCTKLHCTVVSSLLRKLESTLAHLYQYFVGEDASKYQYLGSVNCLNQSIFCTQTPPSNCIQLHQHLSYTKYTSYLYLSRRLIRPIFPLLAPAKAKLLSFTQLLEKFPPINLPLPNGSGLSPVTSFPISLPTSHHPGN